MKSLVLKGFYLWFAVFVAGMMFGPLRASDPVFFETLISLALTLATIAAAVGLFGEARENYRELGIRAGLMWAGVNLALDSVFFAYGPMAMDFISYIKDIGLAYAGIFIITAGIGELLERRKNI